MRPHFSPTYRVPSGTSRAKSEVVFSDLFRRKLRDGRSRKDRAERGRHHAKGTRYVGELFGRPVGSISCHSVELMLLYEFYFCKPTTIFALDKLTKLTIIFP